MKYFIPVLFILAGCSETQYSGDNQFSQDSTSGEKQHCENIDIYYNCILNKYPDMKEGMVSVNYDPDKTPEVGKKIADECLEEQGVSTTSGNDLDSMQMGSHLVNKCKYQVTDYYSEYDFFIQFMSCGKRETKKMAGCL